MAKDQTLLKQCLINQLLRMWQIKELCKLDNGALAQNVGMIARQAGQQGMQAQQQAAGQGASMQAQQQLGALGAQGGDLRSSSRTSCWWSWRV